MLPRPSSSKARPWVAAALLLCLALLSPVQAQQCYRADQQANIRSRDDICSGSKGSILPGDIVRITGAEPRQVCYTWAEGSVLSGGLGGTEGWFNLDALSPAECPDGGAPTPNAPCKNPGEQCWTASECCQVGPGGGPPVRCQAPDTSGSPKVCSGGAIVSSIQASRPGSDGRVPPSGVAIPTAAP